MNKDPITECLQAGFQALLRGDTAERDRQMVRAKKLMDAQKEPPPIELVKQPDGSYRPAIHRKRMS